ncbi:MAG: vitamin K epoxide reductase family protein [Patescibacteria group bacterium]
MAKKILLVIAFLSVLGIVDASYLTYHALAKLPLPCTILEGCNAVAASPYSKVFGVPLSAFGVLFYLGVFLLATIFLFQQNRIISFSIRIFALVGFVLSVYFTYLQAFVIKAFCIYCVASAVISTLIFILSFWTKSDNESTEKIAIR